MTQRGKRKKTEEKTDANEPQNNGIEVQETRPEGSAGQERTRKLVSPEDFFRLAGDYPHKTGLSFYVYRLWPIIVRSLAGIKHSYIDCVPEITREFLAQNHGGGEYKIIMTDAGRPKGMTEVYRCVLKISETDYPPVLDVRELDLGRKENQSFIQALRLRGVLPREGEELNQNNEAVSAVASLAREVMNQNRAPAGGGGLDVALKVAELMRPKSDPLELALKISEMSKKDDGAAGLVKTLMEQQTQLFKLIADNRAAPAAAADVDPLKRVDETLSVLGRFGVKLNGRDSASSRAWWEVIPEALQAGSNLLQAFAVMRGGLAGVPAAPAAVADPAAPGAGVVSVAGPVAGAAPGGASMVNPARVAAIARKAVAAFESGAHGEDFAWALLLEEDGEEIYNFLAGLGAEQMLTFIKMSPAWPQLAARESEIAAFLAEFVAYGQEPAAGAEAGKGAAA